MAQSLATFAGGCFWCMVKPFDRYEGVVSVVSGYTGGDVENPSYELVCTNTTGHREAVQITFDDEIISYEELTRLFFGVKLIQQIRVDNFSTAENLMRQQFLPFTEQ